MKLEAHRAIILGVALVAYGIAAILWTERARFQRFAPTPRMEFAKSRRDEMMAQEHGTDG